MKVKCRRLALLFVMVFLVGAMAVSFTGCKGAPNENDLLKLEAEQAVIEPSSGSANKYVSSASSKSENITSNAKYVQKLDEVGTKITWFFQAESEKATELYLVVANGTKNAGAFTVGGGAVFSLTLNGTALNVPATSVLAASEYLDNWQFIKMEGVTIQAGENRVVLEIKDTSGAIHIDYLAVNKKMAEVSAHTFDWKDDITEATCLEEGLHYKEDQNSGYRYLFTSFPKLGHNFGDARFDATYNGGEGGMIKVCKNCGDTVYAGAAPDEVFGEVYDEEDDFMELVRSHKTVFEGEDAATGLPNGYDGAKGTATHISTGNNSSGDKFIANTSGNDNYVKFDIIASEESATDIAFRIANTRNTSSEILPMDPMSDYVSFKMYNEVVGIFQDEVAIYNTGTPNRNDNPSLVVDVGVNEDARAANKATGAAVNFDFTVFPGIAPRNFYHWRYVVVKNIYLAEGLNSFVFRPVEGQKTIPNIDVLNFYTETDCITPYYFCDIDGAEVMPSYASEAYTVKTALIKAAEEETPDETAAEVNNFNFVSGQSMSGDLTIKLSAQDNVMSLASIMKVYYNGKSVQLIPVSLATGDQVLVIPGVGISSGNNVLSVIYRNEDALAAVTITEVAAYTAQAPAAPIGATCTEEGNAQYDFFQYENAETPADQPAFIFEAEAEGVNFGGTIANRESNGDVSGGQAVGNLEAAGRKLVWKFTVEGNCNAVIAIRAACSNYQSSPSPAGNKPMFDLSQYITLTVDGVAVDLSGVDLPNNASYFEFEMIVLEQLSLATGEHTVELISKGKCPNVDVLYIFTDDAVTFAPVAPLPNEA